MLLSDAFTFCVAETFRRGPAHLLGESRFLPWFPDVLQRCRASRDETEAVFVDDPVIDVDVVKYEGIVG